MFKYVELGGYELVYTLIPIPYLPMLLVSTICRYNDIRN